MKTDWPKAALSKGAIVGKYQIIKVLGIGGFGVTYLAKDQSLSRLVALKEHLPSDFAARSSDSTVGPISRQHEEDFRWAIGAFLKEAKTLASFDTAAIVSVYDYFEMNGTAYMVMKYIEGESLKEYVKRNNKLSTVDARNIFRKVTGALKLLHRDDIFHRDLKPANIMIPNGSLDPVIIDFGSARQLVRTNNPKEVTTQLTEGFAPLEQYSSDASFQGPWTDIYGFAATLYYSLTLQVPADAARRNDHKRHGKSDPLLPLEKLRKDLTGDFINAIEAGLKLDEKDRPQSVDQWVGMVDWRSRRPPPPKVIPPPAEENTSAIPPTAGTRVKTQHSGGKGLSISLSLVAVILIFGGMGYHFAQQRDAAQRSATKGNAEFTKERASLLLQQKETAAEAEKRRLQKLIDQKDEELSKTHDQLEKSKARIEEQEEQRRLLKIKEERDRLAKEKEERSRLAKEKEERARQREEQNKSKNQSNREIALQTARNYYQWGSSEFGATKQLGLLRSPISYFGKTHQSLTEIRSSQLEFCNTWTSRSYPLTSVKVSESRTNGDFVLTTEFKVNIQSESVTISGERQGTITVRFLSGNPFIVGVSSKTVGIDVKTFNAEAQERIIAQFVTDYFKAGESGGGRSILDQLPYFRSSVAPYYDSKKVNHEFVSTALRRYARTNPIRRTEILEILAGPRGQETVEVECPHEVFVTKADGTPEQISISLRISINFASGAPLIQGIESL